MIKFSIIVMVMCYFIIKKIECRNYVERRIMGGFECDLDNFPYFVSIHQKNQGHICGGTLFAPKWVLTAASCFTGIIPKNNIFMIYVGLRNLNKTYKAKHAWVKKIYIHDNYNVKTRENDIAILRIDEPIYQTKFISYIRLRSASIETNICNSGTIIGFGKQEKHINEAPVETVIFNPNVQCALLDTLNATACKQFLAHSTTTFCSKVPDNQQSPCYGDTGGPFICNGRQIGIMTYNTQGCGQGFPSVNTDVSMFLDYIKETINSSNCSNYLKINSAIFLFIYFVLCHYFKQNNDFY